MKQITKKHQGIEEEILSKRRKISDASENTQNSGEYSTTSDNLKNSFLNMNLSDSGLGFSSPQEYINIPQQPTLENSISQFNPMLKLQSILQNKDKLTQFDDFATFRQSINQMANQGGNFQNANNQNTATKTSANESTRNSSKDSAGKNEVQGEKSNQKIEMPSFTNPAALFHSHMSLCFPQILGMQMSYDSIIKSSQQQLQKQQMEQTGTFKNEENEMGNQDDLQDNPTIEQIEKQKQIQKQIEMNILKLFEPLQNALLNPRNNNVSESSFMKQEESHSNNNLSRRSSPQKSKSGKKNYKRKQQQSQSVISDDEEDNDEEKSNIYQNNSNIGDVEQDQQIKESFPNFSNSNNNNFNFNGFNSPFVNFNNGNLNGNNSGNFSGFNFLDLNNSNLQNNSFVSLKNTSALSNSLSNSSLSASGMTGLSAGQNERLIGNLTEAERREKVDKYLEKKKNRRWKNIRYKVRQNLADSRQRSQGRFIKSNNPRFTVDIYDKNVVKSINKQIQKNNTLLENHSCPPDIFQKIMEHHNN